MAKKKSVDPENIRVLPEGRPFKIVCAIEQTDQFQADFLGAYGDMMYDRARVKKQTVIAVAVFALLSLGVLLSNSVVNSYLVFTLGFGAIYLIYGIYFCKWGYKNDYRQLQKHLERAVNNGITVYEPEQITYDFQDTAVYLTYGNGVTRYFRYEDIRYFEQTDRFYIFGMKYLPREKHLTGYERAIFTKRYLDDEKTALLEQVISNVSEAYEIKPILEKHPFK